MNGLRLTDAEVAAELAYLSSRDANGRLPARRVATQPASFLDGDGAVIALLAVCATALVILLLVLVVVVAGNARDANVDPTPTPATARPAVTK